MTPSKAFPRARTMSFPTRPVLKDLFRRQSAVSLDFIVVGGSVAGLSCAYNLKQAGHNVRVLERSSRPENNNISGGIRVPPNMTRLLMQWGLSERLANTGVRCPYIEFIDSESGNFLSELVFHEEVMKELQADMYGLTYMDLYNMIYDITVACGVQIDYDTEVVDVDIAEPGVLLVSGEMLRADIIVGADGAKSIVRQRMVGYPERHKAGPFTGYTFTVPVDKMMEDPELRILAENKGVWKVWMGENTCVLTFLVRPNEYAVQLIVPEPQAEHNWERLSSLTPVVTKFDAYEEKVRRLLRLSTHAVETRHILQEPLEDWSDDRGHVVLIGDAAHNLNPGTSHGSALAMEDAAVLGSLFSRLRTRNSKEIVRLLSAYQEVREERCSEVSKSEFQKVAFSVVPKDDPMRAARDEGFAASRKMKVLDWENLGDPFLQGVWEEFKGSFGYEAYDAADDWWVDWGVMRERMAMSSNAIAEGAESPPNCGAGPFAVSSGIGLSHVIVSSSTHG